MTKHVVWSNMNLNIEDWRDGILEQEPNLTESQIYNRMIEINDEYIWDVRSNLDIKFKQPIIIIADLGLWNGRVTGYKLIHSGNIKECLYADGDYAEWYVDSHCNLRATVSHHDGTNYYLYRVFKDNISGEQVSNFLNKIYCNKVTSQDISRVTKRIGDPIVDFYGWRKAS